MARFEIIWNDDSRDTLTMEADYLHTDDQKVELRRRSKSSSLPGPARALGMGDETIFVAPLREVRYAREVAGS